MTLIHAHVSDEIVHLAGTGNVYSPSETGHESCIITFSFTTLSILTDDDDLPARCVLAA